MIWLLSTSVPPSGPLLVGAGEVEAAAVALEALLVVVAVLIPEVTDRVTTLPTQRKQSIHSFFKAFVPKIFVCGRVIDIKIFFYIQLSTRIKFLNLSNRKCHFIHVISRYVFYLRFKYLKSQLLHSLSRRQMCQYADTIYPRNHLFLISLRISTHSL